MRFNNPLLLDFKEVTRGIKINETSDLDLQISELIESDQAAT
jgi:hypothetical protein